MILETGNLSFAYDAAHLVLDKVLFALNDHAVTAIIGCNGSGKSTLLKLLAGIIKPTSGSVRLKQRKLEEIPRREVAAIISYLSQNPEIPAGFTVMELLECGRFPCGSGNRENREIIRKIMEETGIVKLKDRQLNTLSGGEKQRVFLAFALVREPEILLLDEPFSALDPGANRELFQLLIKLKDEHGLTVAAVLHDINRALKYCDFIAGVKAGKLLFNLPASAAAEHIPTLYDLPENSCITDINGNKYFL